MIIWGNGIIERYREKLDYAQIILYPLLIDFGVSFSFTCIKANIWHPPCVRIDVASI